jgi:hypothetical protein
MSTEKRERKKAKFFDNSPDTPKKRRKDQDKTEGQDHNTTAPQRDTASDQVIKLVFSDLDQAQQEQSFAEMQRIIATMRAKTSQEEIAAAAEAAKGKKPLKTTKQNKSDTAGGDGDEDDDDDEEREAHKQLRTRDDTCGISAFEGVRSDMYDGPGQYGIVTQTIAQFIVNGLQDLTEHEPLQRRWQRIKSTYGPQIEIIREAARKALEKGEPVYLDKSGVSLECCAEVVTIARIVTKQVKDWSVGATLFCLATNEDELETMSRTSLKKYVDAGGSGSTISALLRSLGGDDAESYTGRAETRRTRTTAQTFTPAPPRMPSTATTAPVHGTPTFIDQDTCINCRKKTNPPHKGRDCQSPCSRFACRGQPAHIPAVCPRK